MHSIVVLMLLDANKRVLYALERILHHVSLCCATFLTHQNREIDIGTVDTKCATCCIELCIRACAGSD